MNKTALKKKLTMAKSWRGEMRFQVEEAQLELSFWLKKPPETLTPLGLNKAIQLLKDAIRIQAFANALSGDTIDNYVEEAIKEDTKD